MDVEGEKYQSITALDRRERMERKIESRKFVSKRRQKSRAKRYFFALPVPTARGGRRDGWGKGKVGQDQEPRPKNQEGGNKTGRIMRMR
jgi:hypothetical protein